MLLERRQFVSVNELSTIHHVSKRSIRYDLEKIEYYVEKKGAKLLHERLQGVRLVVSNDDFKPKYEESNYNKHLSPTERKDAILKYLFEKGQPISSNKFAQLLFVTRRTIVEDLKEVEKWLIHRNLALDYVQNKGFVINGPEQVYRQSYVEVASQQHGLNDLPKKLTVLSDHEFELINNSVTEKLNSLNHRIINSAKNGLVFHIAITIHRVKNGNEINMPIQELESLKKNPEFMVAKQIKEDIEMRFELAIPEAEIGYITLHLLGAKMLSPDPSNQSLENASFSRHVKNFIQEVSFQIGVDLTKDNDLYQGLLVHLRPAIHRLKYNLHLVNPLKNEISNQYPDVVEVVNNSLHILEEAFEINFNTDEQAYIALHIGSSIERQVDLDDYKIKVLLVCGSGMGTSQLLKTRLERYFHEIEIEDTYPLYDITESYLQEKKIDWVISTIPTKQFSVPTIKVGPFLPKEDRDKISSLMNIQREKVTSDVSVGPVLGEILTPELVSWDIEASDWMDAIKLAVNLLIKEKKVTQEYLDAIMQLFDKHGPYMVIDKGIAMPHAKPSDGVNSLGISFIKLKNPIAFGHSASDPISIVICLASTNAKIHLNALRQLTKLLKSESNLEDIIKSDKSTFLKLIDKVSSL
ncbi:BglG family transcription antiterminator [Virgibacillus necropolis]|uniref:BglG family transcription antiterminator n=1 Tax=Virgibacillus necropolis TaxID=163877 RepID=UPI001374776A|nr:BglG family transcription antiterminator [Virgibacillus necropolis]